MKKLLTRRRVEKVFNSQINLLASLDIPASIMLDPLAYLMEMKEKVVSRALEVEAEMRKMGIDFSCLLVPVLPLELVDIFYQSRSLLFKGSPGHTYFTNDDVSDLIETSTKPYFILGLTEGYSRDEGSFLTLPESLSFCLQSDVLERSKCYIVANNSQAWTGKKAIIHIYRSEHPKVGWEFPYKEVANIPPIRICPACYERIF